MKPNNGLIFLKNGKAVLFSMDYSEGMKTLEKRGWIDGSNNLEVITYEEWDKRCNEEHYFREDVWLIIIAGLLAFWGLAAYYFLK